MEDNIDLKGFTEDEKKVIIDMVERRAEAKTREVLEGHAIDASELSLNEEQKFYKKDAQRLSSMTKIWKDAGWIRGTNQRVTIQELLAKDKELTDKARAEARELGKNNDAMSTDHPLLIPRVISNIAREAIEPNLVLTPLLSRINFSAGTRIVFPAWGAMVAADIPETGEYPERSLDLAGEVECIIGKSGVACKMSEEMLRYSQFDVMAMHLRAAGRALARLKEQKAADMITSSGVTLIDNGSTGYKSSTGRAADGSYNGTLTLDDLFYAFAQMVATGFTPNALIMHPFAWQIFAQEGIARAFGFINGMNPLMWQAPMGQVGSAPQWRVGSLNQNTYVSSPANIATTFSNVPSIFPTNFRVIVTPYMPYTASSSLTDIALVDINEMGVLVVDEEVTTDQWNDPARDLVKVKFRERYGISAINNGKGIGMLKNIKIARSFDFADSISLALTGISPSLSGDGSYSGQLF